jgi:4-amino-4-deoxy-L-arabinose transferase-like glycosyltransferase
MKAGPARKSKLKLETRKQKSESGKQDLRFLLFAFCFLVSFVLLHYPQLRLPYYWDEAGYYIPAAMDFFRSWRLVPSSTLLTGHTPLVIIYLALAWRAFGFSPLVTRAAMIAVAAGTLAGVYALGRRVADREIRCWSVLLLALSPLFFAQSTLAHLDLAAGLFTLLALTALLDGHPASFALASTAAVLSKETAVVLLPVAWIFSWREHRRTSGSLGPVWWAAYLAPIVALIAWAGFYHHVTGHWTGNREYLRYNLYATLHPIRVLLTLLRRLYETLIGGFNWLLTAGAIAGIFWARKHRMRAALEAPVIPAKDKLRGNDSARLASEESRGHLPAGGPEPSALHRFFFLGGWLIAAYLAMLSVVGGAILPRYLLPIFPPLVLIAVILIWRLPRPVARSIMAFTAGCFVWAWFLNPPYPFPYEDNLAYADFIGLHERAAEFLEAQAGGRRILTSWPASDELARPFLGYVRQPLNVVPLQGFSGHDFDGVSPESFDCLYLYSRRWEPPNNWLERFPWLQRLQERYFEYQLQAPENELAARYHLRLLASFERRGQWVRIYVRE